MLVYTYTEARQNFASLLDKVAQEGEVWVKRRDGQVFAIRLREPEESPLKVEGVALEMTSSEIVGFVHEGRRNIAAPIGTA